MIADLDSAFKDQFISEMDARDIALRCAAGQAHWQNGVAERHGASWKTIYQKVVIEKAVLLEEVADAIATVNEAKNSLRNRSGYSPRQWVFGTNGARGDDDTGTQDYDIATPNAKFARLQALRNTARTAFFETQASSAVRQAMSHRARVEQTPFEPGALIYYHRLARQGRGKKPQPTWMGPATVIGREGSNYWVARGGRCVLVAPEHVRSAHHEEVSELLRTKVALAQVRKLIQEGDAAEVEDETGHQGATAEGEVAMDAEDDLQAGMPAVTREDRLAAAQAREVALETARRRKGLLDDVPHIIKKARVEPPTERIAARSQESDADIAMGTATGEAAQGTGRTGQQVLMAARRCSERGREKQLEKEIPWSLIPPQERDAYRAAEETQWQEHLQFGAVRPLTLEETRQVRQSVAPERILRSRYAYRDKNHSKRKLDPSLPPKAKARLCVSGQLDPDLQKDMSVDAPTAGRQSVLLAIQVALCRDWFASIGDIRAAFLNGVPAPRDLYFEQPKRGIPSMEPGALVEILKGVFGLSTSPKLWWMKLSTELKEVALQIDGEEVKVVQNEIDPCIFMLVGKNSQKVRGLLLTHVDDLLLLCERALMVPLQQALSAKFPVDAWLDNEFEYLGCQYTFGDGVVEVAQQKYAETRVEEVNIPQGRADEEEATPEQVEENRTAIGSLSWLAKQTRPDLQFGVSQCQRNQNRPTVADLRSTNRMVKQAKSHKEKTLTLRKIDETDLALYAFHDAAWGNVDDPNRESGDELWFGTHKMSSQLAHVVFAASRGAANGQRANFSLLDWKSKASSRVCRSTFAGETMSCCEAMENLLFLRALLASMLYGPGSSRGEAANKIDIHLLTDCKSLYDHVHREGTPKAPADKRLAVDLADIRQTLMKEAQTQWKKVYGDDTPWSPERPCRPPLHWIPTEDQLSDMLTKQMKADTWWATLQLGYLDLPLSDRRNR